MVVFHVDQTNIAVFRIGCGKRDKAAVQSFQWAQIVGSEDQLPFSLLRDNAEQLSQKVFKYAGIQFIDGNGQRRFIVYTDEKMQDGYNFFDSFRFVLQGNGFLIL